MEIRNIILPLELLLQNVFYFMLSPYGMFRTGLIDILGTVAVSAEANYRMVGICGCGNASVQST